MKTIFTLIILAFSVCSFGQKLTSSDVDKAANYARIKTDSLTSNATAKQIKGTKSLNYDVARGAIYLSSDPTRNRDNESDTIGTAHVGFSEATQKMFSDSQAEISELQKELQDKVKRQDDMFSLLCGAAVPPVDPKRVIKDGIQIKPGELILKYRK